MTTDGTTDPKDTSAGKQDASKGKQETSKETPETFTEKTQAKAVSDALAIAGRTAKAFDIREQTIKDAEVKALERQKERDVTELEAAEPDERPLIQRKQALKVSEITHKQEREQLEREKSAHQVVIDAAKATKFEADVIEIAKEQGVNESWLKELGITDIEQLKTIAKGVLSQKPSGPDSSRNMGGGVDWRELPPGDKVRLGLDKTS